MNSIKKEIIKGFKVRIYPDKEQERLLFYYCDIEHSLWNNAVGYFKNQYKLYGKQMKLKSKTFDNFTDKDLYYLLDDHLKIIPCNSRLVRNVYYKLFNTYKDFLNPRLDKAPPKFHKYNPKKQSFRITDTQFKVKKTTISFPKSYSFKTEQQIELFGKKISNNIKVAHKYFEKFNISEINDVTYTYERGKWYLSGFYRKEVEVKQSNEWLGLDWGILNFFTDNNGVVYNYPLSIKRQYYRIRRLQSLLDKKKVYKKNKTTFKSNNYKKLDRKLDKAWVRFDNLKTNFIEQNTSVLSNYNIVIENLTNSTILKNTKDRNRLQLIAPRHKFKERLNQKCNQKGNKFIEVNPAYTSLTCNNCGLVKNKKDLPTSVREYNCECGFSIDRDINAALNIVAIGYKEDAVNPLSS